MRWRAGRCAYSRVEGAPHQTFRSLARGRWRTEIERDHLSHARFEAFGRHEMVDQPQARAGKDRLYGGSGTVLKAIHATLGEVHWGAAGRTRRFYTIRGPLYPAAGSWRAQALSLIDRDATHPTSQKRNSGNFASFKHSKNSPSGGYAAPTREYAATVTREGVVSHTPV